MPSHPPFYTGYQGRHDPDTPLRLVNGLRPLAPEQGTTARLRHDPDGDCHSLRLSVYRYTGRYPDVTSDVAPGG
ncbi:hypothetical protein GCM10010390_27980 [Streptomyces mordarskii]|uniref:Uncharacterized protein n=1 Tax=Streptomyces mordarskii TaxID=1226758 RepID=A0ABP3MRP2_9ACTN